jgi:hypothetical protein
VRELLPDGQTPIAAGPAYFLDGLRPLNGVAVKFDSCSAHSQLQANCDARGGHGRSRQPALLHVENSGLGGD